MVIYANISTNGVILMNEILESLRAFKNGQLSEEQMLTKLENLPYEDIGFCKIDHHREQRTGFPEVIFCEGKTPEQVGQIAQRILSHSGRLLATRADKAAAQAICQIADDAVYHECARIVTVKRGKEPEISGNICVVSAGTADIPVAEEVAITCEMLGHNVDRVYDVGVSGIHRLLSKIDNFHEADVIVAVAGMEGALASVVGGLTDTPVIAVPTSVGYGASFGGVSALLTMLNSCAAGVGVVNIDNGFGAAWLANNIIRTAYRMCENKGRC